MIMSEQNYTVLVVLANNLLITYWYYSTLYQYTIQLIVVQIPNQNPFA